MSLFYRRVNSFLGSPASATPQPAEPEDQFEPFEPFTESCEDPEHTTSSVGDCSNRQSKSVSSRTISSQKENASSLGLPTPRKSTLLSSLSSSPEKVEISGRDVGLKETPQVLGGFRGGVGGSGSRPSPASRLSFIDRKWLERCQVFGEMEADVKPGAGNKGVVLKGGDEGGMQTNIQCERVEKGEKDARRDATENDEELKNISRDNDVIKSASKPSHQTAAKSKKVKKKTDEEQGGELTALPIAEDENKLSNRSKSAKKGGRKRQREEENAEGALSEEGGVKKRCRNAKSKEETSGGDPDPAQAEGKKRKAKKKEDENREEKVDGDTKVPKKVS